MENFDEKYIKLEKEYQQEIETQKKFYEAEIQLLKSKLEFEQTKLAIEYKNIKSKEEEQRELENYYNVKNVQDKETIQRYFEKELASQKEWYEEEIKRRQEETAKWNQEHYANEIATIKNEYEAQINELNNEIVLLTTRIDALNEKYEAELSILSEQLLEQKKYYEEKFKPMNTLNNITDKVLTNIKENEQKKQAEKEAKKEKAELLKAEKLAQKEAEKAAKLAKKEELKAQKLAEKLAKEEERKKQKEASLEEENIVEETSDDIVEENDIVEGEVCQEETTETEKIAKSDKPKVSIILPVYNVGKYLRESLDSLINQTLKDIEIICINDGSTDNCFDILEEYKEKDDRIIVVHKENKGTGAARNDGLRLATGECIGFVDPDDWVKPNMFERLYNLIKEKDLDIAMCMPDGYDEKNGVIAPFPYFVDANFKNIIDDRIFNWRDLSPFAYPMCVWNKLYTKKLFDENNIEYAEGLDFEDHKVIFGTLLTAEKIFFIREKLYVYRYNREGSVLTDNNRRLIDHIEIFNIVEQLMKDTKTFEPLKEDFLTYKIHNILYYYSMIKDEFKEDYYKEMAQSIKDTNLTESEKQMLCNKYPELKTLNLV